MEHCHVWLLLSEAALLQSIKTYREMMIAVIDAEELLPGHPDCAKEAKAYPVAFADVLTRIKHAAVQHPLDLLQGGSVDVQRRRTPQAQALQTLNDCCWGSRWWRRDGNGSGRPTAAAAAAACRRRRGSCQSCNPPPAKKAGKGRGVSIGGKA
jgi:hypothetical protein